MLHIPFRWLVLILCWSHVPSILASESGLADRLNPTLNGVWLSYTMHGWTTVWGRVAALSPDGCMMDLRVDPHCGLIPESAASCEARSL
jgi:hypothetical protein